LSIAPNKGHIMEVSLYVSSLPDDATAANLAEQFEPFGRLTQKVVLRKKAGLLFGFVNLWVESEEEVEKCIAALHNSLWRGQRMRVERAKTNPDAERQKTFLKKFEENVAAKAEVKGL
jgi:RNA recognition motif-containing protein